MNISENNGDWWVIVSSTNNIEFHTLSLTKEDCIKSFLTGILSPFSYWEKEYGYRCIKVNIQFTEVK